MSTYAITKSPTPLYNTPSFPDLKKDSQGLIRNLEIILFPGTKLTIKKEVAPYVCEITTLEYPSESPLYIDRRFLLPGSSKTPEREKHLPSAASILKSMTSLVGTRYFWGGNWSEGIAEMQSLYPHFPAPEDQDDLICKGLDCSGLLYQVTNGFTPRNTSQLVTYGQALASDEPLKPLDMMVWRGHVIWALDADSCIESFISKGVIISPLKERFSFFSNKLHDENKLFSFRRWHPEFLT